MTSQHLTELLQKLVSFPSETSVTKETSVCFEYLKDFLTERSLTVTEHSSSGFASLVATTQLTTKPKVLLQAHMDVVPAKSDLYKMTEKDGKLCGRGVYDMKFAAACYLKLVDELQDELKGYDLGIMFTSDEEIGGANGVGYLLEQGYSAGVCILPDGGNDWEIETGCNGAWIVRLIASGQSAHGSRPWEGENAITKLMGMLAAIQELFGELKPMKSSLTISGITGGTAVNQVPAHAEATIDMRFVNEKQYQRERAVIETLVAESGLELETIYYCQPCVIDITQPEIASFIELAETLQGRKLGQTHSLGCSDARFFVVQNIPTIVVRPTGGCAHADDEWLDAADFQQFYELLKAYVIQSARIT